MSKWLKITVLTVSLYWGTVSAQIPVELFTGNQRTTLDIMFFKFFKNKNDENSRFLFFNRNRMGAEYQMSKTENLPQFGFTEAVSYNHPKLKGFAPVMVAQVFSSGIYPKVGVQFVQIKEKFTLFSWLVSETQSNPTIDYYLLFRYTPSVTPKLKLFTQIEALNTMLTASNAFSFSQRLRIGLKKESYQFGLGFDLSEKGQKELSLDANSGVFLRVEF